MNPLDGPNRAWALGPNKWMGPKALQLEKSFFDNNNNNDKTHENVQRPENHFLGVITIKKRASLRLELSRSAELPIFHVEPIREEMCFDAYV